MIGGYGLARVRSTGSHTVDCQGERLGEVGETATCTATPARGGGTIEATVTKVNGLLVNFDDKVVQ